MEIYKLSSLQEMKSQLINPSSGNPLDKYSGNALWKHMLDEISSTDGYVFTTTAGGCFVAGTPVLTKDGWCLIENLKIGDLVLSKPEDNSGPSEYKPVIRTFVHEDRAIRRIVFHDEKDGLSYVFVTDEHPIWVEGLGWTPARLLEPYHTVELANGDPATVMQNDFVYRTTTPGEGWVSDLPRSLQGDIWSFTESLRHIRRNVSLANELELLKIYEGDDPQLKTTVYNIEMADFHTYYASCMWVHNTSPEHFVLVNKETGLAEPPHGINRVAQALKCSVVNTKRIRSLPRTP